MLGAPDGETGPEPGSGCDSATVRIGVRGVAVDSWARRTLSLVFTGGLLLMVAVVAVPVAAHEAPAHEAPLLVAVPLVLVLQLSSGRVEQFVDWLLFGYRSDPVRATWNVARQLDGSADGDVLPELLRSVGRTLRLSYGEVRLRAAEGEHPAATWGSPAAATSSIPLRHRGQDLGVLVAARRDRPLGPDDSRLLRALASQVAVLVHAQALAADLQRVRESLVLSREDERRRLRRDLHDGVGPALAGIALGVDAALRVLGRDDARARELLTAVRDELDDAIADVRRAVEGLRPPLLDELGLTAALTQLARGLADRSGIEITVRGDAGAVLPAATEVGAYRIVAEALTNVVRHSEATRCEVALEPDRAGLYVRISDDGVGAAPEPSPAGTGLASMRERAEELGGRLAVEAGEAGTAVCAWLPRGPA